MEFDVGPAVDEHVLAHSALRAAQPDAGDVVVVEAGPLPWHPGEHPRVDVLVLVHQLVAALLAVDADKRLPEVGSLVDVKGELLQLVRRQETVAWAEIPEGCQRRREERRRSHHG